MLAILVREKLKHFQTAGTAGANKITVLVPEWRLIECLNHRLACAINVVVPMDKV